MKCEICKIREASTILRGEGEDDERYVCAECAGKAADGDDDGEEPEEREHGGLPEAIDRVLGAFDGMIDSFGRSLGEMEEPGEGYEPLSLSNVDPVFVFEGGLHLEGLFLLGELEPVKRALRAMDMAIESVKHEPGGRVDAGHAYAVLRKCDLDSARRVLKDMVEQERNARIRLLEQIPRVLPDTICRSLAILKNARLLAPGEYFDLLSPLRLACIEGMLDGITLAKLEKIAHGISFAGKRNLSAEEIDRRDGKRADRANEIFRNVKPNRRGGGFLHE